MPPNQKDFDGQVPYDLIEHLWYDSKARSRNANFERFRDDSIYRMAVKRVRSLRSFRRDLIKYRGQCHIVIQGRRNQEKTEILMILHIPGIRLRRTLCISEPEFQLLKKDPVWDDIDLIIEDESSTECDKTQ